MCGWSEKDCDARELVEKLPEIEGRRIQGEAQTNWRRRSIPGREKNQLIEGIDWLSKRSQRYPG
jgi:hypothetical protein